MSKPYYRADGVTLHLGDSLDIIPSLPDASVDAVVCDPPYALTELSTPLVTEALTAWVTGDRAHIPATGRGFMGREWDRFVPPPAIWDECLRVLKPGGHLVAFAGARTVDLMGLSIRLVGFEVRDSLHWIYGSGFPKSLDVSKAIDKRREDRADTCRVTSWLADQAEAQGVTRRAVDEHMGTSDMGGWWLSRLPHRSAVPTWEQWQKLRAFIGCGDDMDAEVWRLNGRKGTPGEAWAQREVIGTKKVIPGVAFTTTGPTELPVTAPATEDATRWQGWGTALKPAHEPIILARKPLAGTVAGTVLAHGTGGLNIDACRTAAGQDYRDKCASVVGLGSNHDGDAYGEWTRAGEDSAHAAGRWPTNVLLGHGPACTDVCSPGCPVAELGSDARFFPVFRYEAKASSAERPRLPDGTAHPTVKPVDLMSWLVRLVTPPGGTVLEPFAGSGATLEACIREGVEVVGIERHEPYAELCKVRLSKPIETALFGDFPAA